MPGWLIVPVKSLVEGKSRLAGVLSAAERRRLNEKLLAHVVAVARDGNEQLLVVSGCEETRAFARTLGTIAIDEPHGGGLNSALAAARDYALAQGGEHVLIVSADLPLVTAAELGRVCAHGDEAVICRDRHGRGTNALYLTRPQGFRFAFGEGSAAAHQAEAMRCGLEAKTVDIAGIGFDIDTPADFAALPNELQLL
jgi:2-phospho-L-lactate/phosphoenolpyruvate guanylyltransferase